MRILFYILCTLCVLGFIDFLTSSSGTDFMREHHEVEVERWGYITIFMFEMGVMTGSLFLLKSFMLFAGLMNQAWAFWGFIALVIKFKYLNKQKIKSSP